MNVVNAYNKLHNQEVFRSDLENLLIEAQKQKKAEVIKRLSNVLNENPETDLFIINIKNPIQENNYLTIQEAEGLGVPYFENDKDLHLDTEGLGAKVSKEDIYDMIFDNVSDAVTNVTGKELEKLWEVKTGNLSFAIPINFVSKRTYTGTNFLLLKSRLPGGYLGTFENPYFLTFKQIQNLKGKLKKGAKSYKVIYYSIIYEYDDLKIKFSSNNKKEFIKKLSKIGKKIDSEFVYMYALLKYYNVFNGSDITGIDFKLGEIKEGKIVPDNETNRVAELIVSNYPKPAPRIQHGGNSAFYMGEGDFVQMPFFYDFKNERSYYSVLFHELTHSTGVRKRLNRSEYNLYGQFISERAKEELVAELGAVFISAHAGYVWRPNIKNHAEYLKSWNNRLTKIKKEKKFLIHACSQAQKSTDFILNYDKIGNPKYFEDLKKPSKNNDVPIFLDKQETKKHLEKKKEGNQLKLALNGVNFKTLKEAKKHYLNWALKNLRGKKVFHKELNKFVVFNRKGIEHALSYKTSIFKVKLITQAEKMLKNSEFIEFLEDNRKRKEIKGVYRMKSTALVDDKEVPVIITLREGQNGVIYYDHKIEKLCSTSLGENSPTVKCSNKVQDKNTKNVVVTKKENVKTPIKPKKGLNGLTNTNSLASKIHVFENKKFVNYDIQNKSVSTFLGDVEHKEKESVVITVTGGQGSGKTRFTFQLMDAFGRNYKVGHASMEEHPESSVYWKKVHEYISSDSLDYIENPEVKTLEQLDSLIQRNDVIIIDSFAKLQEIDKYFEIDKDLRKKYNGKLFIVIFQETSDGKMRGGSKSQFDGDIILFTEKHEDYTKNYIWQDKNRYQDKVLSDLRYSIYHRKLI